MPDLNIAIQIPTATPTEIGARPNGANRKAISTPNKATATARATTDTWLVYTVAITTRAARSSTTASVSRNTRMRVAVRGVTSATAERAKAVSVDIAAAHPCPPARPALKAR